MERNERKRRLFTIAKAMSFAAKFACMRKQRTCLSPGRTAPSPKRLGKTRDICRLLEIDVTAEAPDELRHCERSCEVCDYRPHADRVVASSRQLRTLSYEEAFKIWTVKEQRPGFTGLVKWVDIVAETRVVLEIFLFYIYN